MIWYYSSSLHIIPGVPEYRMFTWCIQHLYTTAHIWYNERTRYRYCCRYTLCVTDTNMFVHTTCRHTYIINVCMYVWSDTIILLQPVTYGGRWAGFTNSNDKSSSAYKSEIWFAVSLCFLNFLYDHARVGEVLLRSACRGSMHAYSIPNCPCCCWWRWYDNGCMRRGGVWVWSWYVRVCFV